MANGMPETLEEAIKRAKNAKVPNLNFAAHRSEINDMQINSLHLNGCNFSNNNRNNNNHSRSDNKVCFTCNKTSCISQYCSSQNRNNSDNEVVHDNDRKKQIVF